MSAQRTRRYVRCDEPSPMSRPPRLGGFDYLGVYAYALTFCVAGRRPVFENPQLAGRTADQILITARLHAFAILAYCLMPDHAHVLAEGRTADANLPRFVKSVKQRTGQTYAFAARRPLWQPGYFDRVIRTEDDTFVAARYIVWNPVRAGLVARPADYPHLGSEVWSLDDLLEP